MTRKTRGIKPPKGDRNLTHDPARLKHYRVCAGMTIKQLAEAAGVGAGTICDLENSNYSARVETLHKLAPALGCEVADLLPQLRPRVVAGDAA